MTTRLQEVRPDAGVTPRRSPRRLLVAGLLLLILLCALLVASILIGSRPVSPATLIALLGGNADADVLILLRDVRIPRTFAAVLVGIALAWAGALMQGMTRNPLADPGLLGVSAGAAFAVTIALSWLGVRSAMGVATASVIGAAIMTVLVLTLGLRGSGNDSRLILAGVAFSMTVGGIQTSITLLNPRALDAMRAWSAGSLATPDTDVVSAVLPLIGVALVLALLLARPLNALALGDDAARGLGSHPLRTRAGVAVAAALLVGAATAIAGPIGFAGLMIPHLVRPFTGPDTGRILLASAVAGPVLLLGADVIARVALWPGEIPVGIVTAALGAPVLLLLIRRGR